MNIKIMTISLVSSIMIGCSYELDQRVIDLWQERCNDNHGVNYYIVDNTVVTSVQCNSGAIFKTPE